MGVVVGGGGGGGGGGDVGGALDLFLGELFLLLGLGWLFAGTPVRVRDLLDPLSLLSVLLGSGLLGCGLLGRFLGGFLGGLFGRCCLSCQNGHKLFHVLLQLVLKVLLVVHTDVIKPSNIVDRSELDRTSRLQQLFLQEAICVEPMADLSLSPM